MEIGKLHKCTTISNIFPHKHMKSVEDIIQPNLYISVATKDFNAKFQE